ncbi:MAG: ATP-binding protein [Thermoleophilia bacterium]|nr:ATP-binding protein [Thermoleophilia bacterium]
MKLRTRSLRQKIFFGYVSGVAVVFAFVLLSWNNLNNTQEMVSSGEAVSSFFDATLEIRRFEKNFFLYRTGEDYRELNGYIREAQDLLGRKEFYLFTSPEVVDNLSQDLRDYSDLLKTDAGIIDPVQKQVLEGQIREKGKDIVTTAEMISNDRDVIAGNYLQSAKQQVISGVVLILVAGLAGGLFFYDKAVKPLSVLEKHMQRIADGEFSLIPARFDDRELVSLKAAFNKMLIELQERQQYLVESEKFASLGTLVFGVAHELNNPLSNIFTSSQILKEEMRDDNLEYKMELIDQIEAETARARDVVTSLLDFSRTKQNGTFSLDKAIDQTIRFIKAEIPAQIRISTAMPENLQVYGDRQQIQQMILNLIKNAVDAIKGEGTISISASRAGEKGEMVEIHVRDNGAGMGPETLSKIFDPFFTSKKKGYGLGLFVVHNVVEKHGGIVDVDSQPGMGTTFIIQLPAREPKT